MKNNKNVKCFCPCNRCEKHAKQRANKKKFILFSLGVVAGAVVTCYALRNRQGRAAETPVHAFGDCF